MIELIVAAMLVPRVIVGVVPSSVRVLPVIGWPVGLKLRLCAVMAVVSVTVPAVPPNTALSLPVETAGHVVPAPFQLAVDVSQFPVPPFQLYVAALDSGAV